MFSIFHMRGLEIHEVKPCGEDYHGEDWTLFIFLPSGWKHQVVLSRNPEDIKTQRHTDFWETWGVKVPKYCCPAEVTNSWVHGISDRFLKKKIRNDRDIILSLSLLKTSSSSSYQKCSRPGTSAASSHGRCAWAAGARWSLRCLPIQTIAGLHYFKFYGEKSRKNTSSVCFCCHSFSTLLSKPKKSEGKESQQNGKIRDK